VRGIALHPDVLVVTSAVLHVNCVVVRGPVADVGEPELAAAEELAGETFVIDSPVLPEELDALPALLQQAGFPAPSGLLATHGDWDHLLGRLAFPGLALGCAESSEQRLRASPGAAQRELRSFDDELYIERPRPLALGSVQALPVPGRCGIGDAELELYAAEGHTGDGMAIWIPWAGALVVGDYLSPIEIPSFGGGGGASAYADTLGRLRPLVERAEHVVPGHGPALDAARALVVLEEDFAYLDDLVERGERAALPPGRRSDAQRELHAGNARVLQELDRGS
jgi:glyoxylase-like metal-dependent hydrolase (beta-lactamase superfamily II)